MSTSLVAMEEIVIVAIMGSVATVVAMERVIIAIIISTLIAIIMIIIVISFDIATIKGFHNATRKTIYD